jgi:hypothetical protein
MTEDTAEELTKKQLEAVKQRAIELWGEEKWLPQLVRHYERAIGAKERSKFTQVHRYFLGQTHPTLTSMNGLLLAVDCQFRLACTDIRVLPSKISIL